MYIFQWKYVTLIPKNAVCNWSCLETKQKCQSVGMSVCNRSLCATFETLTNFATRKKKTRVNTLTYKKRRKELKGTCNVRIYIYLFFTAASAQCMPALRPLGARDIKAGKTIYIC